MTPSSIPHLKTLLIDSKSSCSHLGNNHHTMGSNHRTMMTPTAWSLSLLVVLSFLGMADGQLDGSCSCSPTSYTFTFDFALTCPPVNVTRNGGIEETFCLISPFGSLGENITDLVPVEVASVDVVELGINFTILSQENITGPFLSGDSFTYTSIVERNDSLTELPKVLQLNIYGFNSDLKPLVNVFALQYTNLCDVYPVLFEGESAGWTEFTTLGPALVDFCPAAGGPTGSPAPATTDSPTAAPIVITDAPSVTPIAPTTTPVPPTEAPVAVPTDVPIVPTASPVSAPTDAPIAPTDVPVTPAPTPAVTTTPPTPTVTVVPTPTPPPVTVAPTPAMSMSMDLSMSMGYDEDGWFGDNDYMSMSMGLLPEMCMSMSVMYNEMKPKSNKSETKKTSKSTKGPKSKEEKSSKKDNSSSSTTAKSSKEETRSKSSSDSSVKVSKSTKSEHVDTGSVPDEGKKEEKRRRRLRIHRVD